MSREWYAKKKEALTLTDLSGIQHETALPNGTAVEKLTLVPILLDYEDPISREQAVFIQSQLALEQVSSVLSADNFSLWKDYLSLEERKRLGSVQHALIHRFNGHVGDDKEDEASRLYMNHVFICLRLIKPIRRVFQTIQAFSRPNGIHVYSISHPAISQPAMPITQTLNTITTTDIEKLKRLLPSFMKVAYEGPLYLQRAVRFYEQGFSATVEPALQFLSWMIGIESIISRGMAQLLPKVLVETIAQKFGDIDIKRPQWRPYLQSASPLFVRDTADHLLTLRNCLVHAQPIPDVLRKEERDHLGQSHELAAYINAAAAMILQTAILQEIAAVEH